MIGASRCFAGDHSISYPTYLRDPVGDKISAARAASE